MTAFFGLLFVITTGWWFWIILFTIALINEDNENYGFLIFFNFALLASLFFGLEIHRQEFWSWWYVAGYIPIGILYSAFRWWRHCNKIAAEAEALRDPIIDTFLRKLEVKYNMNRISAWVTAWPSSIVYWGFSDVIGTVKYLVVQRLGMFYHALTAGSRKRIEDLKNSQK